MCAQVVPAASEGNEDVVAAAAAAFVCCAQAGSVGKQSVGKEGEAAL